jgi:hypothetical protein
MSRRIKPQQPLLDERLDEIVEAIVSKQSALTNKSSNAITNSVEDTSRIKTMEVLDWKPQKPTCPRHKSEMIFDKAESKWKCPESECNLTARRRENSTEPDPNNLPSGEVLIYWDKERNKYYLRQNDRLISLPSGSIYQNYLPYEVSAIPDAIGQLTVPIKYLPIEMSG